MLEHSGGWALLVDSGQRHRRKVEGLMMRDVDQNANVRLRILKLPQCTSEELQACDVLGARPFGAEMQKKAFEPPDSEFWK